MSTFPPNVTFNGGFSMPAAVWHYALDLEGRGVTLSVDDQLLAQPRGRLTPDDFIGIRRNKEELKRLVTYCNSTSMAMSMPA